MSAWPAYGACSSSAPRNRRRNCSRCKRPRRRREAVLARLINVVGTRLPGGDFATARRWYADHVQQLLGFPGLAGAALYRRADGGVGEAPDLLCCYDFGDASSFAAYEASEIKRAAERDRQSGWGRDGIAICLRARYEWLVCSARDTAPADWPTSCRIGAAAATPSAEAERALAAGAFEREAQQHLLLRAVDGGGYLWFERPGDAVEPVAHAGLAPAWSAGFDRLHVWRR